MMWSRQDIPRVYLVALCCWREARGTSVEAQRGVLHVLNNRARRPSWWGHGHVEVVLKPWQFSSFNANDPNAVKFPAAEDPIFNKILELTENVLTGDEDLTGGATHYHDSSVHPNWADTMLKCATIGPFSFYKEYPKMKWTHWLHGLLGAVISSSATTVGAVAGSAVSGTPLDAKAIGGAAAGGAIAGAVLYLKQSPVPNEEP